MSTDSDKLVSWVREAANEIETAHALLDHLGIPDGPGGPGSHGTLAARIHMLSRQAEALAAPDVKEPA